jgi:hypothetical protein
VRRAPAWERVQDARREALELREARLDEIRREQAILRVCPSFVGPFRHVWSYETVLESAGLACDALRRDEGANGNARRIVIPVRFKGEP